MDRKTDEIYSFNTERFKKTLKIPHIMKTTEYKIRSHFDELDLSVLVSTPDSEQPKAVVQFAHGMCEHKERYLPFMEFLCRHGYACIIHDHRGHGRSVRKAEDLGYFYKSGWEAVVGDIFVVNGMAKEIFPEKPVFLFGHSMGSLAVRCFVKRFDDLIDGLIVCGSPSKNPATGAGLLLTRAIASVRGYRHRPKLIQKMAFEGFNKKFEAEGANAWLSTDRKVVEEYNENPLCGYAFTANGYIGLFNLMKDCYDLDGWKISKPEMPVLFIAGTDDPCITSHDDFILATDYMRIAGYENVRSHLYNGMRHEILNETDKEVVWKDVLKTFDTWLG